MSDAKARFEGVPLWGKLMPCICPRQATGEHAVLKFSVNGGTAVARVECAFCWQIWKRIGEARA